VQACPPEDPVSSEQFYETDPSKPYKRGYSIQNISPLPITWASTSPRGGTGTGICART